MLTDDGQTWVVDHQRLEEIALLTRLMIEATGRSGPLEQAEIDALLAAPPTVLTVERQQQHLPTARAKT